MCFLGGQEQNLVTIAEYDLKIRSLPSLPTIATGAAIRDTAVPSHTTGTLVPYMLNLLLLPHRDTWLAHIATLSAAVGVAPRVRHPQRARTQAHAWQQRGTIGHRPATVGHGSALTLQHLVSGLWRNGILVALRRCESSSGKVT